MEPKTIQYFRQQGFKMVGAKKGQGSVLEGIKKVKRFRKIYCSDECVNTVRELKHLTYKKDKKTDNIIEDEFSIDSHVFDSIRYALDGYEVSDLKDRKNYSGKGAR